MNDIRRKARLHVTERNFKRKFGYEPLSASLRFRLHVQNHPNYLGRRPAP